MRYMLLLLVCGNAQAGEIKVKENPVPTNSFAEVALIGVPPSTQANPIDVAWEVLPTPVKLVEKPDHTLYFSGLPGVKYQVVADVIDWKAMKRTKYRAEVAMGGDVQPPKPPPVPVPPTPVDAFTKSIMDAYATEPTATRQTHTRQLAAVYRNAANVTVDDPNVKTYADLFAVMDAAMSALAQQGSWTRGAIPSVRTVVGERLKPLSGGTIDRTKTASEFKAVATALDAAAK